MAESRNVVIEGCTGTGKSYLACCIAKRACNMRRSARYELLVIDEWLTEDVDDVAIRFLFELIERRYMSHSTVLCTQYAPAEWHGRLSGGVQADAMVDRLIHGAVRIDLGDVNVRKLVSSRK